MVKGGSSAVSLSLSRSHLHDLFPVPFCVLGSSTRTRTGGHETRSLMHTRHDAHQLAHRPDARSQTMW